MVLRDFTWTSTLEVNMMSRMCLENYRWQNNLVKKTFWLKKPISAEKILFDVNVQHQFDTNS